MKKISYVILLLLVLTSCKFGKKEQKQGLKRKRENHVVKRGSISIKLEETGEIQPSKEVEIKSSVSGKILKFYVNEGDYVASGDTICTLEPDINQANQIYSIRSNLKLAEIRLSNANDNLVKKEKLFKDNFISKTELEDAQDELEKAKIDYTSALKQNDLISKVDSDKNIFAVVSDAFGTVIQKPVEVGEMIVSSSGSYNSGTVLVKLADLEKVIVTSTISEVDISKIHKNQRAKIKVDAFPHDNFSGYISKIAAMATEQQGVKVFPIEIKIDKANKKLRPGMTANVTIKGETKEDIITIPIRAIFSNEMGDDIVYKIKNDSTSVATPIKTGINDFMKVEILEGVDEGDVLSLEKKTRKLNF